MNHLDLHFLRFSKSNKYQLLPKENDFELKSLGKNNSQQMSYVDSDENETFLESPIDLISTNDYNKNKFKYRIKGFLIPVCILIIFSVAVFFFLGDNKFTLSFWKPYLGKFLDETPVQIKDWKEWKLKMNMIGSESCVRLFDVDNDGLDDIIFGAGGLLFYKPTQQVFDIYTVYINFKRNRRYQFIFCTKSNKSQRKMWR